MSNRLFIFDSFSFPEGEKKMKVSQRRTLLRYITKSKFLRSLFLQIVSIFLIVVILVIGIAFFSFATEIKNNVITERQIYLGVIENTVSRRMQEITSISYNVGTDMSFYLSAVDKDSAGYEMSNSLKKYLVGNDFIEHLAYYKLSEPDILYTSTGKLSFSSFWSSYLGIDEATGNDLIKSIQSCREPEARLISFGDEESSFFAYTYPLPQFSENPQAFVLILVPQSKVTPVAENQLANCFGKFAVFDSSGKEIYSLSNLDVDIPIDVLSDEVEETFSFGGKDYVTLRAKSESNGWTYVSVIRLNDIISSVASKQMLFIVLLFALMIAAVFVILACVVNLYKPINSLAMALSSRGIDGGKGLIDEESLLSDTFATLRDESDQKQKFEEAFYAAQAANQAKSSFLSNVSHDIRTPMNAIVGMTEIAIQHSDDPDYVRDCLQKVRISSQYLLDIINNVLDMSRIESGKLVLAREEVDLPKLVYGLITILNQSVDVKSQTLTVEVDNIVDERFIGDSVRLSQVFMNILSNSVKFTPNGGTIGLRLSQTQSTESGYGDYVFVFTDTGVGMSPEFTRSVFDTFSREKTSLVSKTEGTGLGMAIVKSFVELMGGSIECESEPGKGTTFTIKLHMELAGGKANTANGKYAGTSVLIAGGNSALFKNESKPFAAFGVSTEYSPNFEQAVERITRSASQGKTYDFVIINLPEEDKRGIGAAKTLLSASTGTNTTFILATRDLLSVEQSYAYNSGISAVVQLPLFNSSVLSILNRAYELRSDVYAGCAVNLEGMNVLLVEDNDINREIAHTLINETNATVYEAVDGKQAVDLFKEHEAGFFDIILMDLQMPVMNGYEATAAIRSIQREDALTIPIYAMTANTFDEDVRQVREARMNGHIGKPYVSGELYKILEQAFKHKNE